MKILHYMKQFISDPKIRVRYLSKMGFYNMMQDEEYLKKVFKTEMGYDLNLENPKTFSEKIQWLNGSLMEAVTGKPANIKRKDSMAETLRQKSRVHRNG